MTAAQATAHAAHHEAHHHKHHVSSWQFLTIVLVVLLFLTGVTVAASRIDLGGSLNLALALAIAFVKAGLVCAFFMHLAHDKPFNTVVLFYCLMAVACFLLFTVIDLSSREAIDPIRDGAVAPPSVVQDAREAYIAEHGYDPAAAGEHDDGEHGAEGDH